MARLTLVHWHAEEAEALAEPLRRAGHEVRVCSSLGRRGPLELAQAPPDAFVVSLDRVPSKGRDLAIWLRRRKATRRVPQVLAGGDPAKAARAQALLPDALVTDWGRIRGAVRRALRAARAEPVVPDGMAAYRGRRLDRKLGIRPDSRTRLIGAPPRFEKALGELPPGARVCRRGRAVADRVLLFARSLRELEGRLPAADRALADGGGLWIAWPKKASGIDSDLTQVIVRRFAEGQGWVDYKIAAIDATWSGLLFARRPGGPKPSR